MKYICFEDDYGKEEIVLFPKSINHDCLAEGMERLKDQTTGNWSRVWRRPVSAGFVTENGTCYGGSVTLGVESREKDTALLASQY